MITAYGDEDSRRRAYEAGASDFLTKPLDYGKLRSTLEATVLEIQARKQRDGSWTLVENHCPICAAAEVCQGLCAGELELFRRVLGARVERTEHLLDGARRCVYRITPSRS